VSDPVQHLDRLETPMMHQSKLVPIAWLMCAAGIAAFVATFFMDGGAPRAWSSLLGGLMLPLWMAVGSLFFLAVHAVCGARWIVPLSRVMEGVGAGMPVAILAFLALGAIGLPYVYEWSTENPLRDSLFRDPHGSKAMWMTDLRWFASGAIILAIWATLQRRLATAPGLRLGVATLLILVPTFTLFVWDTLLSLHVQFVSAIFGGYCLVSSIHVFLGCTALALAWLSRRGLASVARPHLLKDVGTWLVAWSCMVAYVCYAQYIIIAFMNADEETFWYLMRVQHGYGAQFVVDIVLRCGVPFVLLMSQSLRAKPWALGVAGAAVLAGTWLELHWLIVPAFSPNHYRSPIGPEAVVALACVAGTFLLAVRHWRRRGLVPVGHPDLLPAINAEHLH
jgi:hypothetical protein